MRVAILGAGVVGVTTAWFVARAGHTVTLVDREAEVASATSYANGSQLCYSFTDSMASPAFALKLPGLLAGLDPAIRIRPPFKSRFMRWSMAFLRGCTVARSSCTTEYLLRSALRSAELLESLRQTDTPEFSFRPAGKLVLLRSAREKAEAIRASAMKAKFGCDTRVISLAEAIDIEPAVSQMHGNYVAAVYSPGDAVGDARAFARSLADKLQQEYGAELRLNTVVGRIAVAGGKVRAVQTESGEIEVDAVVVCLGAWSPPLLKPLGIDPVIYPARGYSLTLPVASQSPLVSITDLSKRFVISRLDDRVRIAGFVDFVGFGDQRDQQRTAELMRVVKRFAPQAADYETGDVNAWGGFRPMTASGRPLTGGSKIAGLYLNTGHGFLGWTLACVSGFEIARLLSYPDVSDKSLAA